jgi:hypothetical protein
MISNYQADILTGIDNDVHWADKHHLMITDPYLNAPIVLVKNIKVRGLKMPPQRWLRIIWPLQSM